MGSRDVTVKVCDVDRLAYIHENFFTMDSDGVAYHEVCLFFLMKPNMLLPISP